MKKNRKLMARAAALAMAAVMALGLSVTAFAADGDDVKKDTSNIDHIAGGATDAQGGKDYPGGLSSAGMAAGGGSLGVDQYIDKGWQFSADGIDNDADDKGTIAVSGLDAEKITVNAYQFIAAQYDNGGHFSGYKDLTADVLKLGFVDNAGNAVGGNFTRGNIAKVATWAQDHADPIPMPVSNGTATAQVQPGSYVIVVTADKDASEVATYGAMVVSCYYTYGSDKVGVNSGTLGLVRNLAYAKKQSAPDINKIISGVGEIVGDMTTDFNKNATVVDTDDYVWFDVKVLNIPEYHGAHSVFKVTDTIDSGLEYDPASVQVAAFYGEVGDKHTADDGSQWKDGKLVFKTDVDGVKINDITGLCKASQSGNTITFDFAENKNYTLNDYAGYNMIIRYRAEVTADGHDAYTNGIIDMPNNAVLEFTHNSNVDGNTDEKPTGTVHVYTCTAEVLKTDAANAPLPGAEFELYMKSGDSKIPYYYRNEGDEAKIRTATSGNDGKIVLDGLSSGTYYLKETKAPDGYSINGTEYKIVIEAFETDEKKFDNASSGTVAKAVVKYGEGSATDVALKGDLSIPNSQMTELPSTGGAGTALLVGLGIVGAIAGMLVLFGTRKKQDD